GGNVNQVYRALLDQTNLEQQANADDNTTDNNDKGRVAKVLDIISGIFVPIVPVLAGSGMLKALLTILSFLGWISSETQTYQLISIISDAGFYFLPLLLAHSASIKFKTHPYVSMA